MVLGKNVLKISAFGIFDGPEKISISSSDGAKNSEQKIPKNPRFETLFFHSKILKKHHWGFWCSCLKGQKKTFSI